MADLVCPTCGPTATETHPRRPDVTRCSNCKEHLAVADPTPTPPPEGDNHEGLLAFLMRLWRAQRTGAHHDD